MAARSNAWVCDCFIAGIPDSNPARVMDVCRALSGTDLCLGWSLVHRNPTECCLSECDRKASITWRPWPNRGCRAMETRMTCQRGWYKITAKRITDHTYRTNITRSSNYNISLYMWHFYWKLSVSSSKSSFWLIRNLSETRTAVQFEILVTTYYNMWK